MVLPDLLQNLEVRDIMISPVPTIRHDMSLKETIKILVEEKLPAAIVLDNKNETVGYVELYTLVNKVLEGEGDKKIISFVKRPLPIVKANKRVIDVMRIFTLRKTPIIAVLYKGHIMGYVTTREMIRILPEIIDSILTTKEFEERPLFKVKTTYMGYCDRCGAWSDKLVEIDGNYYCPDCVADLFGETIE